MPTAVLVHGGFHGSWCWRRVARPLRERGWEVYAPTLSGAGEHAHAAHAGIGLDTHVQDVVNLLEFEDLDDVVLVGHSAAGLVVTPVADRVPERIREVVYLDCSVPSDGESLIDVVGSASPLPNVFREQADAGGGGWQVPPAPAFTAAAFGVEDADDVAWVEPRLTPHPLAALADKARVSGAIESVPRTYVRCTAFDVPALDERARTYEKNEKWRVEWWPCGHDVMVTEPDRVVDLLLRL